MSYNKWLMIVLANGDPFFINMPFFSSSQQFYATAQALFDEVQTEYPQAADDIRKAKLLIRFNCVEPEATIMINGRREPVSVSFGENHIRPEIDVDLTTDTLHYILMGELGLANALKTEKLKVHGPMRKVLAVVNLFHQCQAKYPRILREQGLLI
jgi:putative sterol carrier protein